VREKCADVDCRSKFCFIRPTKKSFAGAADDARVLTCRRPTSVRPTLPVSFAPNRMGTSCPDSSPIRRLKKGTSSVPGVIWSAVVVLEKLKIPHSPGRMTASRKEKRKTRQVDLARIHFGFAEVGIYGQGQFQTWVML